MENKKELLIQGKQRERGKIAEIRNEAEEEEKWPLSYVVPIKNAANLSSANVSPNERGLVAVM